MVSTRIIVTLRVPGFHCWPLAPGPIEFLRDRHRHQFTVRVEWAASADNERKLEFYLCQRAVHLALCTSFRLDDFGFEFGEQSCEMIALNIIGALEREHVRPCAVEVWEDDENGCRLEV